MAMPGCGGAIGTPLWSQFGVVAQGLEFLLYPVDEICCGRWRPLCQLATLMFSGHAVHELRIEGSRPIMTTNHFVST